MARIFIKRTKTEWIAIGKFGNRGLPQLIRMEISHFVNDIEKNPERIKDIACKRIQKEFLLPEDQFTALQRLSIVLKIPVCTIVDELIIAPLLLNKE